MLNLFVFFFFLLTMRTFALRDKTSALPLCHKQRTESSFCSRKSCKNAKNAKMQKCKFIKFKKDEDRTQA